VLPCVLLAGNDPNLASVCRQCAALAAGARLEVTDMGALTTRAAELRPFAIVVPEDLLDFDPEEFVALARTVNATLVPISIEAPRDREVRAELVARIRTAYEKRGS